MMRPVGLEEEPVSPRSDSGDSAQWCVVSPGVRPKDPRPPESPAAPSGLGDVHGRHLELHPVPIVPDADLEQDISRDISSTSTPRSDGPEDQGSEESQKRWNQAEKLQEDIRKAGEAAPPKIRSKCYFKILVAGAPASGKTTFIQNLSMTYGHNEDSEFSSPSFKRSTVQSQMQHSASTGEFLESFSIDPTNIYDFQYWPADLCTRVDVSDEAGKVDYQIHIQDSPGFHSKGPETDAILSFIREGNVAYMDHEQDKDRTRPMSDFEDTRVDVCLYFIAPHNLRPMDIVMMDQIGKLVPVIPVVAKGDSLTKAELDDFRAHISEELRIGMPGSPVYHFDAEDLITTGLEGSTRVFSVISSCIVDASLGRHWPVRSYPWGTAEALRSKHSDVLALRRLLFELSFDSLKRRTNDRYYKFRAEQLNSPSKATAEEDDDEEDDDEDEDEDDDESRSENEEEEEVSLARAQRLPSHASLSERIWGVILPCMVGCLVGFTVALLAISLYHTIATGHAWSPFAVQTTAPISSNQTQARNCLSSLDLSALQAPDSTRFKELWALVSLAQAVGEPQTPQLCAQERGALAYQAGMAKAELVAAEKAQRTFQRLSASMREAVRAKMLTWRAAAGGRADKLREAVRAAAVRVANKLPVRVSDGAPGTMTIDIKALKRIITRCGVMGLWL